MRIQIPPVVRPVRLCEYAEEYGDATIWMWVNLPRDLRFELAELQREFMAKQTELTALNEGDNITPETIEAWSAQVQGLAGGLYAWWSQVWSQGPDEDTHWTVDEVQEFATESLRLDPGLWEYAQETSLEILAEYRDWRKKKPPPKPST